MNAQLEHVLGLLAYSNVGPFHIEFLSLSWAV